MVTGRSLGLRIKGHIYDIRQGYFDTSKLAAREFEEGHHVGWNQTYFTV
jgi:hypothetical protein